MEDPVSVWKVSGISGQDPDAGDWLFLTDAMFLRREHPVPGIFPPAAQASHMPQAEAAAGKREGAEPGLASGFRGIPPPVAGQMKGIVLCHKSVIRLAGAFLMGEMVLSGILSVSVRILLLATPRRCPLRLRLGGKHAV